MRCERTLRTATLLAWGAGLLLAGPAQAQEVLAPASWAGQWDFVVIYRSSDTGAVVQKDSMSNDICPGQPLGLSLFESLPACQTEMTETGLSVHCGADMTVATCRVQTSVQLDLKQADSTIVGGGEWTADMSGDCPLGAFGSGQTIEVTGQRRSTETTAGCAKPSTLVQKFMAQPMAMAMSDRPFATLRVEPIDMEGGVFDAFGAFTLAAESDGIDPRTETLRLQVGEFDAKLPPGSFKLKAARGRTPAEYSYEGLVGRARLQVTIARLARGGFAFTAHAERTQLRRTRDLLPVMLAVGNDTGSAAVRARKPRRHDEDGDDRDGSGHDRDDRDHDDHDHDHDDRDHDGHGRRGE